VIFFFKFRSRLERIEEKIKKMGGTYILVRSLEDFKEQFKNYYDGDHI